MIKDEALRMALEALESKYIVGCSSWRFQQDETITAIKEALQSNEQVEQELTNLERHERNVQRLFGTPQPKELEQERNFCQRCGKRLGKNDWDVHTCTPPQPEQEPVAMKFKIYKPTVPDPTRQGINNALLPWVYDQDRSSGFDASMWVTPVATLPPQRKPLTDEEIILIVAECASSHQHTDIHFARAIERAHGIKGLV